MFNLSFSELLLVLFIFALVVGAGRVGKVGGAIGRAFSKRPRPSDDPRIAVREGEPRIPPRDANG